MVVGLEGVNFYKTSFLRTRKTPQVDREKKIRW